MAKEQKEVQKCKTIEELQKSLEKEFGSGSIMRGQGSIVDVDVFPTGVATIDVALGCGGLPIGRIIEVYGAESSGKTTTCLQFIAACQRHVFPKKDRRGIAAFVDAEHALDPKWASKVGVNMDEMLISQPESGEEALSIVERLVDSCLVDLIVVDSVAALTPKSILLGEIGDSTMAALAQLMSKALSRIKGKCNKTQTTVIFVNQVREKVGIVFGNPELTPGGRALKFYSSIRAEVKKGSAIKDGTQVVGFRPSLKVVKNKVAAPFMIAEYDICVGLKERPVCGIDTVAALIEVSAEHGIVNKNGSFFVYSGKKLGNGISNATAALRLDQQAYEEIKKKTYEVVFGSKPKVAIKDNDDGSFDESESDGD
jgi:recombination protein RecA